MSSKKSLIHELLQHINYSFENDIEYAKEFLNLYLRQIPSAKEDLVSSFKLSNHEDFYSTTLKLVTSFRMVGFSEIADELYSFALSFRAGGKLDELATILSTILEAIDSSLHLISEVLNLMLS